MPSTVSEEAVLLEEETPATELEETPTVELVEETPTVELVKETPNAELEEVPTAELLEEPTPTAKLLETPTAKEGIPTVDMRQFLAGLETLTPEMLSEISTHIERLCQLAALLASTKSAHMESPPPLQPTRHTDGTQPHGASLVKSNEQLSNVTIPPTHTHTPSRCGRD